LDYFLVDLKTKICVHLPCREPMPPPLLVLQEVNYGAALMVIGHVINLMPYS
jgi:hypothetical protein